MSLPFVATEGVGAAADPDPTRAGDPRPMADVRWEALEDIFLRALDHIGDDRAHYLERACADDPTLRDEVEGMLRAEESGTDFRWIDRVDGPESGSPLTGAPIPPEHRRIGPWRILRLLGRGGMGQVYLAERDDDQYREQVALKVVRSDYHADLLDERFRAERQILARLRHPNIATLLDGGVTDDGRPYLVMQYESGLPITAYCDEHTLPVRDRLTLFATVCDAVHFAHTNLVVHRDLKPSNILVDDDGRPRLLDFGIAKILEGGLDVTRPVTGDMRLFSPDHAAPEQVRGEPVTTATDVYALGILLYELLAGRRPFRSGDTGPLELHRQVCEEPPTRPSDNVSSLARNTPGEAAATGPAALRGTRPGLLVQTLKGDLDQIVLKALRKEPHRRYASAGQFADDVRRYLAGLPVDAQPDAVGYRVRKFVGRHRLGVATAAAVALLTVGFAGTMAAASTRLAREQVRTQEALDRAETVSEYLIGLFDAANPEEDPSGLSAPELLARGVERAEQLADQPAVQAQMLHSIGRAYSSLARYDEARPLLERGLALRRQVYGDRHGDVGRSLTALAWLYLQQDGDFRSAEPLLQEALDIYGDPSTPDLERSNLAAGLSNLGAVLYQRQDYEGAERAFLDALAALASIEGVDGLQLGPPTGNLALALSRQGRYAEAEAAARDALELNREARGDEHPYVAVALNILAETLLEQGRYDEARPIYDDVLSRRRALYGDDHPAVAAALNNLGQLLNRQERWEEAIPYAQEAVDIQRRTQGETHPLLGMGLKNLGRLYLYQGRYGEAEPYLLEALAINVASLGPDHAQSALVRSSLVQIYEGLGRDDDAARYRDPPGSD